MYAQGNVIVEEKEQHTAGVLRLLKVQYINVFLAKAILVYGVSYLLAVFTLVINGFGVLNFIATSIFIIPFLLMCLFIGAILGDVAKNTIDVSLYGWPILLVYFTIEGLVYSSINLKILYVLPNYHMQRGLYFIERGEFTEAAQYIFVPILWMLLAFLFLRKKQKDAKTKRMDDFN